MNHARFIRALTCQGFQSLGILFNSSCVNLVEINYVIDLSTGSPPGLDYLVDLMSVNPSLRASSIECVDLSDKITESQFQGLLDFLDNTASITSVALVPMNLHSSKAQWETVWTRLCSRVDFSNIHSLCVHTSGLSRSKRTLTGGLPWPARETPISVKIPDKKFRRALPSTGGRWENESRMQRFSVSWPCIAVLENNGCLELCSWVFGHWATLFSLLQRSPSGLGAGDDGPEQLQKVADTTLGQTIRQIFPNLRKLDLPPKFLSSLPQEQLLSTLAGLSTLSLSFGYPGINNPAPLLLSAHSGTLLSLDCGLISTSDLLSIVTSCPNLQKLTATVRHQLLGGPEVSPPWICKNLRKLDIRLTYCEDEEEDDSHSSSALEREKDSARQLAPSLLRQIGTLSRLQDLSMDFSNEYRLEDSPYFQLSMDPDYSLPQFADLQQLKTFKVTGLMHSVGQTEVEWMRTNWPLLLSLEIPILSDGGRLLW